MFDPCGCRPTDRRVRPFGPVKLDESL